MPCHVYTNDFSIVQVKESQIFCSLRAPKVVEPPLLRNSKVPKLLAKWVLYLWMWVQLCLLSFKGSFYAILYVLCVHMLFWICFTILLTNQVSISVTVVTASTLFLFHRFSILLLS